MTNNTVLVAAYDSRLEWWRRLLRWLVPWYNPPNPKDVADFVCDGISDEVEINAALSSLPNEGGQVELLQGHFAIGAYIPLPAEAQEGG